MPKYKVAEQRMYTVQYLIEADDERAAGRLVGTILDEDEGLFDNFSYDVISVEQVNDDVVEL